MQFKMPRLQPQDWAELLWHLADRLAGGNAILVLDEINWLGRSHPMFSTRLWALGDVKLSHLENFSLILSGSLTGWIDDKFSSNTGCLGRISWNITLAECGLAAGHLTPREAARGEAITIVPGHPAGARLKGAEGCAKISPGEDKRYAGGGA